MSNRLRNLHIIGNFASFSIDIDSYRSFNLYERNLVFTLDSIEFEKKASPDFSHIPHPKGKKLDKIKNTYLMTTLKIDEIKLVEHSKSHDKPQEIQILQSKIVACIYDSLYKDHPFFIGKKVQILIPYLNIHVDDGMILFSEIIKIATTASVSSSTHTDSNEPKVDNDAFSVISKNQQNTLINKLNVLKAEHQAGARICKHCVLYHKKTKVLTNIFMGSLEEYCNDENFPFQDLKALNCTIINFNGTLGFKLTIKHSMTLKNHRETETIFSLPFFSITKDVGFFKENIIIYCTESDSALDQKKSSRNLFAPNSNEIIMLKPLKQVKRNFIKELDENFWRHFLNTEKEITSKNSLLEESDLEISLDAKSSFSPISDRNALATEDSESPIFMLYVQKKYLHRNLVKILDIQGTNKDFQDLKNLRIKEFGISFGNLDSLMTVLSTFYSIKFINQIFGILLFDQSDGNTNHNQKIKESSGTKNASLNTLNQLFKTQKIQIVIEKFKSRVNIKLPASIWLIEARECALETPSSLPGISEGHLEAVSPTGSSENLFSIKSMSFSSSPKFQGSVKNIQLKYKQDPGMLRLSIDNIFHQSVDNPSFAMIEIPTREEINNEKKAFEISCLLERDMSPKIEIFVAPLRVSISQTDLSYELSSFALVGNLFSTECKGLVRVLNNSVFQRLAFDKAYSVLKKRKIMSTRSAETPESPFRNEPNIKSSFVVLALVDKMTINLIKNNIVFAIFDVMSVKFKRDEMSHYEAEIGEISLVPYDSYYDNFMVPLDKSMPIKITILKKKHPVMYIENSKVIYMNRVIQEIKLFKVEIEKEIAQRAKNIISHRSLHSINTLSDIDMSSQDEHIMKIKFCKSCFIIPRDCNSRDILVMFFDSADVRIDRESKTFKVPAFLDEKFAIVNSNLIVGEGGVNHHFTTRITNTQISINNVDIFYCIKHRNIKFGHTEKCVVNISTPATRTIKNGWNLEPNTNVEMENFNFQLNLASFQEVQEIINTNFKEKSKIFAAPPSRFMNVNLDISSDGGFMFQTDKSKIEAQKVQELINSRQEKESSEAK